MIASYSKWTDRRLGAKTMLVVRGQRNAGQDMEAAARQAEVALQFLLRH